MLTKRSSVPAFFVTAALLLPGCRALPASYALMVVGDVVSDQDVKQRKSKLLGFDIRAADEMFGERVASYSDARGSRHLVVYATTDILVKERYVVEVQGNRIVALSKTQENRDGLEDVLSSSLLRDKLVGQTPHQCQELGNFGRPLAVLRNDATWNLVHVYDVSNVTHLGAARYCVVHFDVNNRCERLYLVGVTASTSDNPI
jgi:hypothetical protein